MIRRFHTVNNNRIKFSSKYKDFDRTVGEALSSEMVRALTYLKDRLR